MMWSGRCGGRLGARPGWNDMLPYEFTLRGGTRAAYIVTPGVSTLRGGVGGF